MPIVLIKRSLKFLKSTGDHLIWCYQVIQDHNSASKSCDSETRRLYSVHKRRNDVIITTGIIINTVITIILGTNIISIAIKYQPCALNYSQQRHNRHQFDIHHAKIHWAYIITKTQILRPGPTVMKALIRGAVKIIPRD